MSKKIVIIDYGLCNIQSIVNAITFLGESPIVSDNAEILLSADYIVLPGVGAFKDGMEGLRNRNLVHPIHEAASAGKPILGICLGMQLLFSKSYEFGEHEGLGLIPGEVVPFPRPNTTDKERYTIPHIGWAELYPSTQSWEGTLLAGLPNPPEMYFVHSFYAKPKEASNILAKTNYANIQFCSVVTRGTIYGCQFHPEKSSRQGLHILQTFLNG